MYNWSDEQLAIFDEFINPTSSVLAIEATAGAAKSSSLVEATARFKTKYPSAVVRYIVFGAKASADARTDFGVNAIVSTLHAFAFSQVHAKYGLGPVKPFLTWMDIPKSLKRPFGKDSTILSIIEDYCKSKYTTMDDYVTEQDNIFEYSLVPYAKQIMNLMAKGQMPVTHSFYLKLFHVLVVRGILTLTPVDKLLVDEAQDLSSIALDIIERIPYKQLVIVGDQNQRIFDFLNLENGFKRFNNAKVLTLTQSFRVSNYYAPAIEEFLQNNLEVHAKFKGMNYPDNKVIRTQAYITRNNATLINKMVELNQAHYPYNLSSSAKLKQMFKLPLALIYAKPGFIQRDIELKHLQYEIDEYHNLPAKYREATPLFSHLLTKEEVDSNFKAAILLVLKFGSDDIIAAYEHAKKCKGTKHQLTLLTAHTSKGATFDAVELDEDLNKSLDEIKEGKFNGSDEAMRSELCLYFVAVTRHRYQLTNARHLNL